MGNVANKFTDEYGIHSSDVVISGSAKNQPKWQVVVDELRAVGLVVMTPNVTPHSVWADVPDDIVATEKSALVREQLAYVSATRALLVCNYKKDNQGNHVGANALLEMTAAYVWDKPSFILNAVPTTPNRDEILALRPTPLYGDLDELIEYLRGSEA